MYIAKKIDKDHCDIYRDKDATADMDTTAKSVKVWEVENERTTLAELESWLAMIQEKISAFNKAMK